MRCFINPFLLLLYRLLAVVDHVTCGTYLYFPAGGLWGHVGVEPVGQEDDSLGCCNFLSIMDTTTTLFLLSWRLNDGPMFFVMSARGIDFTILAIEWWAYVFCYVSKRHWFPLFLFFFFCDSQHKNISPISIFVWSLHKKNLSPLSILSIKEWMFLQYLTIPCHDHMSFSRRLAVLMFR